ncbi:hypothetical protein K2X89_16880 [Myxococcota bacterium]|nr:hypothetical protein [Myxococcota bacterium]
METWGKVDLEDLEYPQRVGQFTLVKVEDLEEIELGVRLKYADSTHPGAVIDAYVYPITKPELLSLTQVLEWEMSSVSRGMEYVAGQNRIKASEPERFPFGLTGEDPPRGLGVKRILSSASKEFVSLAYLVVRDHRFFKLRITIPRRDLDAEGEGYFQGVLDILQPVIRLRQPFEKPGFALTVYRNVLLAPHDANCNIGGWIAYGSEMMKQIEAGAYRDTLARELSARRGVLEFWRKVRGRGEPCASDVLEMMSRAGEAGFLREYVFEAYDRGNWAVPEDLRLEEWKHWSSSNIDAHDPVVVPGVAVRWSTEDGEKPSSASGSAPPTR